MLTRLRYKNEVRSVCGSLTIEAALGLSLFLFAVLILIMPMKMLDTQRKVQMVLESCARQMSQYAYIRYRMARGEKVGTGRPEMPEAGGGAGEEKNEGEEVSREEVSQEVLSLFTRAAVEVYLRSRIEAAAGAGAVTQMDFSGTDISEDGERIDLRVSYRLRLPFSVFRLDSVPAHSRSLRRGWIGSDGNRGRAGGDKTEESDVMVYVGRTMTRYHWRSDCHYISNDIAAVSLEGVKDRLSAAGARYRPCSVCGKPAGPGSTVYILPNGRYYHSRDDCSSLAFYVREVSLKEVEYLGECSYCRRKKGE